MSDVETFCALRNSLFQQFPTTIPVLTCYSCPHLLHLSSPATPDTCPHLLHLSSPATPVLTCPHLLNLSVLVPCLQISRYLNLQDIIFVLFYRNEFLLVIVRRCYNTVKFYSLLDNDLVHCDLLYKEDFIKYIHRNRRLIKDEKVNNILVQLLSHQDPQSDGFRRVLNMYSVMLCLFLLFSLARVTLCFNRRYFNLLQLIRT